MEIGGDVARFVGNNGATVILSVCRKVVLCYINDEKLWFALFDRY